MPFDIGIAAAASATALSVSFGLAAFHYRRTMRGLQAAFRRRLEVDAEVLESDARHRILLDHAPIGCVVWEPGFRIVEWNRQAELIFGWTSDEAIGRHLIETLFREEDRAAMGDLAAKLFAGAISQHGALTHIGRDGRTIVCEWHHAAVRDRDGNPVRIVSMCLDVSGVREIERENALFRALVEHTVDPAVLLLDEQDGYRVKYANAAAGDHFGCPVADLIGRVPSDWDPHADARVLARNREAVRRNKTVAVETTHRRADGTLVPVELTGNAIEYAGRAYVICYVRDISRRRADQARLRALEVAAAVSEHEKRHLEVFRHSSDALFSIDVSPQGELSFASVNPAAEQAFGVSRETLVGCRLESVAAGCLGRGSGQSLAAHLDFYRACVQSGLPIEYEGPLNLFPADAISLPQYAIRLMPLAADAGIERIVGIGRDVTAQRRYEAERQRAADALAASERTFRSLSENSPDNVARYDTDARLLYANPRLLRTLGLTAEALAGRRPTQTLPDESTARYEQCILDAARSGRETETEIRFDVNGRTQYHHILVVPERDETGSVVSVLAIGRDITERKQLEDVLAFVAQRGWTDRAEGSLGRLAHHLGKALGVDYVIIDRLADEPGIAETAAVYARGSLLPSMRYELRGTPCDNVLGKSLCRYPENIQALFPEDRLLVDMEAESYVGIPLWDSAGHPIGLIAVLDGKPMDNLDAVSRALQIVATAAAAELERERADVQLRKREREFRSLAENSPDHIARYTPDGRFAYLNPRMEAALGMPAAELLGRTPSEAFPDGSFDAIAARIQAAGRDGLASEIEAAIPTAFGDLRYHNVVIVPERAADGSVASVLTVSRDVTEQKQAQRHMALLTRALNHLNDGSVLIKRDGLILNANRAFCAMLGYERNELVGRPIFDVLTDITAADWQSHWDGLLAKGGADLIETANRAKDGRAVPVEVSISLFDFEGETYNLASVRDITERKRMEDDIRRREQEFRTLAENMPDGLVRYDRQARVQYMNPAILADIAPEDQPVLGESLVETFPGNDAQANLHRLIERVIATGTPVELEVQLTNVCGEMRTHQVRYVAECDSHGEIVGALGIGRDITERKASERQLRQALEFTEGVVNAIPDLLFEADRNGTYLNVWARTPELLAAHKEALLGKTVSDVMSADAAEVALSALREADETGLSFGKVFRLDLPRGESWFELSVSKKPGNDVPARFIALSRDVTERKRMQESLAERERSFRSLAENSPDIIARYDREGRRVYVNNAMTRLCGRPAEALIGASPEDGQVVAADQIEKFTSAMRHAFATGQGVRDEVDLIDRDGVRRIFEGQMVPEVGPDGNVESVLIIGHDITAFRDAERLVSRFVSNVPGFAFTLHRTPDGRYGFPFASPGIEKLFGLRPGDVKDEIGPLRRMLHVSDGLDFDARMEAAAKNLASLQFEFRIAGLDGNERWIEMRATPERESDGGILWHGVMLNITKRKRMEDDLRQRELEFRALAENSPDPIFRYDPQGRRLFANRAAASLSRKTPNDLIGKSLTEQLIIPPAVAEQVRRVIATVVETGKPQDYEIDFIGPVSGLRRVMQNRYVPEFGPYGRVVSVLSMSRDITQLKVTLEALSHRERSLAEAQRMGRIGSWELDLAKNKLDWSDEVYRIFEIDQARFGASYEAFLDAIHPDDRDAVNAAYTHSLETREAYSIDHRLRMPDGRVKYVHERCETDYDADGKPFLSRGTVQDVTERTLAAMTLRQREQEFRTLAENSPDIIVRYDLPGRRTYVNQAYLAGNGVAKEQVLGKTVAETAVFPPAVAADFAAMLARVIAGARDDELSMTWRREDGEPVSYFLRAVPEFGDDGKVASILTVARDVTMLKETERRLVESRAELQELTARREDAREEERRRIARDLHEELGQTLSALRMNISMLPLEYAAAVPELRPRTASMLTLTDRVIHGMRQAVMTLRPTALDAGIAAGLEWLAREFEEHIGIPCALRLDDDMIELDDREATTLFRIAQEALANVARHAQANRAELTLRRETQGWLLEVRDDGRGFDPEIVHEKAFGLRSMTERAQSIDGQFSILSSPGDGTVVTLRISR